MKITEANTLLRERICHFYAHETALRVDESLEEWLDLLTEDVRYVMPMRETRLGASSAEAEVLPPFYVYNEDRTSLEARVRRLTGGLTLVESPLPAVQRWVTDILVTKTDGASVEARSNFLVLFTRDERNESFFARDRRDTLRLDGEDILIARRDIRLAQFVLPRTISLFF